MRIFAVAQFLFQRAAARHAPREHVAALNLEPGRDVRIVSGGAGECSGGEAAP